MAKRKVNKSQIIRDYYLKNRTASAKEVVAAMAKKNIKVSEALVANVKSKAGLTKRRGSGKPGRPSSGAGRKAASANGHVSIDILMDAKKLVSAAGSATNAIAAIRAIEKLDSM
ncbi:MAG: hypothetical protein AAF456_11435 [Planctomycetota bacterium]